MYDTTTIEATATDGTKVSIQVPSCVPTSSRVEHLRVLYNEHVQHPDGHWKGTASATVPEDLADDVAEAMEFMGSIVDERINQADGTVSLYSTGYWTHGF